MYFQKQGLSRKSEMLTQFVAFPKTVPHFPTSWPPRAYSARARFRRRSGGATGRSGRFAGDQLAARGTPWPRVGTSRDETQQSLLSPSPPTRP